MDSWIDVITKERVTIIREGHIFFFHWYQLKRFNLILDYLPNPYNRETAFFSRNTDNTQVKSGTFLLQPTALSS